MSDAEHLIENVIFGMKRGEKVEDILNKKWNKEMLASSGISAEAMTRMACHIVYSLYDGRYPTDPDEEELTDALIRLINKVIVEALDHGGDPGGPYCCNHKGLDEATKQLAEFLRCEYRWRDYPGVECGRHDTYTELYAKEI